MTRACALPTLAAGATADLAGLATTVTPAAIAAFERALGGRGVSVSIAVREYARLLWASYEEQLAVTTRYRTRIVRPLLEEGPLRATGRLVRSVVDDRGWRLTVESELADDRGVLATNRTALLVVGADRRRDRREARATPDLAAPVHEASLTPQRIRALEEATVAIWPDHPVENIHTDEDAARATGLTARRFASGMLTTGLIARWLGDVHERWYERYELDVRFHAPAAEGHLLRVGASAGGGAAVVCVASSAVVASAVLVPYAEPA